MHEVRGGTWCTLSCTQWTRCRDSCLPADTVIAYASRTGSKRNLAGLKENNWRILVSAAGVLRTEGFPYALDNGAWSAFTQGRAFDERAFGVALARLGNGADWVVMPDIVAGGLASLELSLRWMRRVLDSTNRGLIAVQDGMNPSDVSPFLGVRVGLFVGGSTAWKLATMGLWGAVGARSGAWVHVGRVNTARRIAQCVASRATSFDGTSATRFAVTIPALTHARDQQDLFGDA